MSDQRCEYVYPTAPANPAPPVEETRKTSPVEEVKITPPVETKKTPLAEEAKCLIAEEPRVRAHSPWEPSLGLR
jgi:hypothetical protein